VSTRPTNGTLSGTVVVADDDAPTRRLIRAALEPDGWTVEEAVDGVHACELTERLHPEIVMLDVDMPRMDGFAACARLRTERHGQHVPIMMITAKDDPESISRAYEAGATDFLSKPLKYTILRQRVRSMYLAERDRQDLRSERDFASAVVEHSGGLVMILDTTGRVIRFNASCERASGYLLSEIADTPVWDMLASAEDREREHAAFDRLMAERGHNHFEGAWTAKDGSRREIAWSNSVLLDSDGAVNYVVCTGLDVTARNEAEERARFLASYDPLTSLPNRRLITERLDQAIATAEHQLAVLVLDLDRFTDVNVTWGYAAGDALLMEVADRLAKGLRLSSTLAHHNIDLRTELRNTAAGAEPPRQVAGSGVHDHGQRRRLATPRRRVRERDPPQEFRIGDARRSREHEGKLPLLLGGHALQGLQTLVTRARTPAGHRP
jgi:PAS domain S-box-containing protein